MLTLVEAFSRPYPCPCQCHLTLSVEQRSRAITALFRFDDAMHGWGYRPLYELKADQLYRDAQRRNDASYRGVAVRDEPCLFRRLVGFAAHEVLHALNGDVSKANYGLPFGLPYGVPEDLPAGQESDYLDPYNRAEARAWLGPSLLAEVLWGVNFEVRTARDVGTYGFVGGTAFAEVPAGFRPVPHWSRVQHPQAYYELARRLEREEMRWFTEERLEELVDRFEAAEAEGKKRRSTPWPAPTQLARRMPKLPRPHEPCFCGTGAKYKKCCGRPA